MQKLAIVHSPLDKTLQFHHMLAQEHLSQVPKYSLELLSEDPDIEFDALLGQHMTVEMDLPEGTGQAQRQTFVAGGGGPGKRYFDGIVSRISYVGMKGRYHLYRVIMQPWLAFLGNTQDCRIFQDKTVIEILQEVFKKVPGVEAEFKFETKQDYTVWPYCVQYAETDLNFVLRMMEQEGITFYFTHEKQKHTLVLADSLSIAPTFNGYSRIPYRNDDIDSRNDRESIQSWQWTEQVKPGRVVLTDYDFTRPNVNLQQQRSQARSHKLGDMEVFAYPGYFDKEEDGEQFVRNQMEAQLAQTRQAAGVSDARGLACGHVFELQGFIRTRENGQYLITGTTITVTAPNLEGISNTKAKDPLPTEQSPNTDQGAWVRCEFTAIDAKTPFRPQRLTPKPRVAGPQTAVVVGPPGEEIYTDEYGRVKVHFHWDRYGNRDGEDTCWVRVSQVWAGQNFGFQAVPRIDQEVVVDFLEGDPDQPLITGRVYNAAQPVPWELPANKTQTGVLTRSTSGGHYHTANAIRFEDKKGQEEIWFHAERNYRTEVENSETKTVGAHRSKTIGGNETTSVKGNRTETVGTAGEEGLGKGNETITVYGNRSKTVRLDENVCIEGNRLAFVGGDHTSKVKGSHYRYIQQDVVEQVKYDKIAEVGRTYRVEVAESFAINCGKSIFYMNSSGEVHITGTSFNFSAQEHVLINGGESVHLNPEGGGPEIQAQPKLSIQREVDSQFAPAAAQISDSAKQAAQAALDALDPATLDPNSPPFIDNPNPKTLQDQWVSMPQAPAPTGTPATKPTQK